MTESRGPVGRWFVLGGCSGLVLAVLVAAAFAVVAVWPRNEVVHRTKQPARVAYEDGSIHYAGLLVHGSVLGFWLDQQETTLMIGRDPSLTYGHGVEINITGTHPRGFLASWSERGVRVRFRSGHVIFVPARYFVGGR